MLVFLGLSANILRIRLESCDIILFRTLAILIEGYFAVRIDVHFHICLGSSLGKIICFASAGSTTCETDGRVIAVFIFEDVEVPVVFGIWVT